jgi:hypothetical protein
MKIEAQVSYDSAAKRAILKFPHPIEAGAWKRDRVESRSGAVDVGAIITC